MATTPDSDTAAAIEVMRTEIAEIATFPPVVPVARALEKAADRLERVVGLLGLVVAARGDMSGELEQDLPRLSTDMASAAEFHRVVEGSYGQLDCPPDPRGRVGHPAGVVSVTTPDGWRLLGPSAGERENQLETIDDADYALRLREHLELFSTSGTVLYDAVHPGASGIGAVVGLDLIPDETDLLGTMEAIEAGLTLDTTFTDVVVRYVDRPAGDGARLVARARGDGDPDEIIVDTVRVDEGLIFVISRVPEADAPTYWLAIERIVGSLRVEDSTDTGGEA